MGILEGRVDIISDKPGETVAGADLVLITVPSFAYYELWNSIKPFISGNAILGALPGNGGFEWIVSKHPGTVFGMQRVPYVCRTENYGQSVLVTGVREKVFIATRPAGEAAMLASLLEPLLQLNIFPLPNYLNASLAPANPVFHSVRNYSLFQQAGDKGKFDSPPLFYGEWDDMASTLFLQCDEEVQHLCNALPLDLSCINSIRSHYQANTPSELSKTIRGIESLKGIQAPMRCYDDYWLQDFGHRFFTEDMLINLPVFLYFGELAGIRLPVIEKLAAWGKETCSRYGIQAAYDVSFLARKAGVISERSLSQYYG